MNDKVLHILAERTTSNAFATLTESTAKQQVVLYTYDSTTQSYTLREDSAGLLMHELLTNRLSHAAMRHGKTGKPEPFLPLATVQSMVTDNWQRQARQLTGLEQALRENPNGHLHLEFRMPGQGLLTTTVPSRRKIASGYAARYGFNGLDLKGLAYETCGRGWSTRALLSHENLTLIAFR